MKGELRSQDLLSISDAANFLGLSRPTFNLRRKEYGFQEFSQGRQTLIRKSDLLKVYAQEFSTQPSLNFVLTEDETVRSLFVDGDTMDLRKIDLIDSYGIISLLVASLSVLEKGSCLYLILSDSLANRRLTSVGFFKELKRRFPSRIFFSESLVDRANDHNKILPLKFLGYKGQDRQVLESLASALHKLGLSVEMIGYLGWIIGELADNSLTHAQGPCYVLAGQFSSESEDFQVAIGDTGKGIFSSLKTNDKYKNLSDQEAFLKAFQSRVTCWSDEAERGKGLCDLLKIAIGGRSLLRVDSKDQGFLFNFINGQKELLVKKPAYNLGGTHFCLLMENENLKPIAREEVDHFIELEMERL